MYLCPETEAPCTAECPTRNTCDVHREPLFFHANIVSFCKVSKDDKLLNFTIANIKSEAYLNGIVD
jgi:hypothetical protein